MMTDIDQEITSKEGTVGVFLRKEVTRVLGNLLGTGTTDEKGNQSVIIPDLHQGRHREEGPVGHRDLQIGITRDPELLTEDGPEPQTEEGRNPQEEDHEVQTEDAPERQKGGGPDHREEGQGHRVDVHVLQIGGGRGPLTEEGLGLQIGGDRGHWTEDHPKEDDRGHLIDADLGLRTGGDHCHQDAGPGLLTSGRGRGHRTGDIREVLVELDHDLHLIDEGQGRLWTEEDQEHPKEDLHDHLGGGRGPLT